MTVDEALKIIQGSGYQPHLQEAFAYLHRLEDEREIELGHAHDDYTHVEQNFWERLQEEAGIYFRDFTGNDHGRRYCVTDGVLYEDKFPVLFHFLEKAHTPQEE